MKRSIHCILLFLCATNIFSQTIGEWNPLFSYEKDITAIVQVDDIVYAVSDGKLFSYDTSDNSLEGYAKVGENDIEHLAYSKKNECVIAIRNNSDIDLIYSKSNYINISDVKNISLNLDKKINDVFVEDDLIYLSTNFGLVVVNIPRAEIKESAIFNYPFYGLAVYNDKLYAFTENGTLYIDKDANIQYPGNWTELNLSALYTGSDIFDDKNISKGFGFDGKLAFLLQGTGMYVFDGQTVAAVQEVTKPQQMVYEHNRLIVYRTDRFWDFSNFDNMRTVYSDAEINRIIPHNTLSNQYWAAFADSQLSLIKFDSVDEGYELLQTGIRPGGPLSNYAFDMVYHSDKLLVTGGAATNHPSRYDAALSEYKNNIWFRYSKEEIDEISEIDSRDFLRIAVDPFDDTHIFVSCFGGVPPNQEAANGGLYEFKDRKFVKFYNNRNTPAIEPVFADVVLIGGLVFDKKGNLWTQSSYGSNNPIVVRKNDGVWTGLSYPKVKDIVANPRMLIVDKYDNKWSVTYVGHPYVFIFNEGNVPIDNVAAHRTKLVPQSSFYDQDGKSLATSLTQFRCIAEDNNGNIWLGTNIGIFLVYNSANIFSSDRNIVFNKIKIPKNDGTNEANILLENVGVNAIAVDGANRKWIGTVAGLYVVSANGLETDYYFTNENSILPSNNVLSLAIDPKTGIVYIGTDKGIVSFRGEATQGADSYSNVYVFPNPVEPTYYGPITVTGLKENSAVKITDIKGNLINKGTSLGGQYIWDGKNVRGERVDTGVYLVFGSSEDGNDGVVIKVMVITD